MRCRKLTPELEREAWQMFLQGATKLEIYRKLCISPRKLRKLIEDGDPANSKRAWRDRRADIYKRFEENEDEQLARTIFKRSKRIGRIERSGLAKLEKRVRDPEGPGLSVAETAMLMREQTQALRLTLDSTRAPPGTQITINNKNQATAGAMAAASDGRGVLDGADERTGARITEATIKALQQASPDELSAISSWQKKYTLALEDQGLALPPAPPKEDALSEILDAPADMVESGKELVRVRKRKQD